MTDPQESPIRRAAPLLAGFFGGLLGAMIALAASDYYTNYAWATKNVLDLRLHPVGFEDDPVTVVGYLKSDEVRSRLYLNRDAAMQGDKTLALELLPENPAKSDQMRSCAEGFVYVSGVFTRQLSGQFHVLADRIMYESEDILSTGDRVCIP